jgi:succinate dehydrogenase/fumarate reductase flavoprotein subunit
MKRDEIATDIVVIGSGGAGLRAAIAAREEGLAVLVLSRCSKGLATATTISGGAFACSGPRLTVDQHIKNTMETGYHLNDASLVRVLAEEAPIRIEELRKKGVGFKWSSTAAVTLRRPPDSGREAVDVLLAWSLDCGVTMIDWHTVAALSTGDDGVTGCVAIGRDGRQLIIKANAVIICTGGASALYKFHDNPTASLGDGYALAHQAGARLKDMEFIQFYPLITCEPRAPRMLIQPFLAETGLIINDKNENLLEKYGLTEVKSIAMKSRDRLSRALFKECLSGNSIYLDLRMLGEKDWDNNPLGHNVRESFNRLYQADTKPVRITPAAHFTIGGIVIDDWARTGVEGLFAAGESACGLHGANRMGGNALSETLVFGYRAGIAAARYCRERSAKSRPGTSAPDSFNPLRYSEGKHLPRQAVGALRETFWNFCGPVRRKEGLAQALASVRRLKDEGLRCDDASQLSQAVAVSNSIETAQVIVQSALDRKESIGAHYRED